MVTGCGVRAGCYQPVAPRRVASSAARHHATLLTHTLRQLERDGLISRHDFGEKPLRVEYALSELGMGLLVQMIPLWTWVIEQSEGFTAARKRYDEQSRPA